MGFMIPSKYFFEMCSAATELQSLKIEDEDCIFNEGDLFISNTDQNFYSIALYKGYYGKPCIWLPRQEDLQNIILDQYEGYKFPLWAMFEQLQATKETLYCKSFEEMWLVFVMKKKYNKIWDLETLTWKNCEN